MRKCIYAGTFDPVTLGHLDIIKKAVYLVDHLIIGVANDTSKSVKFCADDRAILMREAAKNISDKINVEIFSGLLVDFAKKQKANVIIRGLRAVSDFEYEFQMSWINHKLAHDIQTIFLPASKDTQFISSSFVKQIAFLGGDISKFVPKEVLRFLQKSGLCKKK
jgi:pantetheine-phosphate adenylyltransferase